jgi:hypothetical protein
MWKHSDVARSAFRRIAAHKATGDIRNLDVRAFTVAPQQLRWRPLHEPGAVDAADRQRIAALKVKPHRVTTDLAKTELS